MNEDVPHLEEPGGSANFQRTIVVVIAVLIIFGLLLIGAAIMLAGNPQNTAPSVRIVRDLLIIVMSLEILIIGAAFILFLIQLARLVNLINNEIRPLADAAADAVNTVRGTAAFLSKNLVEPVTAVSSTLRGLSKVVGDVDAVRKAAGIVMSATDAGPQASTSNDSVSGPHTTSEASGGTDIDTKPRRAKTRKRRNTSRTRKEI